MSDLISSDKAVAPSDIINRFDKGPTPEERLRNVETTTAASVQRMQDLVCLFIVITAVALVGVLVTTASIVIDNYRFEASTYAQYAHSVR